MEKITASKPGWTEECKSEHNERPLAELVRFGQTVRADTIALLAELSDEDRVSNIPGAPWSDGTVVGIMAAHADHGRMHYRWAEEDPFAA
ncbi:MAG: hypothetical protein ACJAR2_002315 [Ilumatobacter sp.]|jgi:hypothetical protein